MDENLIAWLLSSCEPWTHYCTLIDLLDRSEDDPIVRSAREAMLQHAQVKELVASVANWPGYALKRHNDAGHALYRLNTLADFGVQATDPGVDTAVAVVMAHQAEEGAFQSLAHISKVFGGDGRDTWTWMACDAPTLLYSLLAMGLSEDPRVQRAIEHMVGAVDNNGWRCTVAPELGRFKGPGRRDDPCPIANVVALKALSHVSELLNSSAARIGTEMLLRHWENQTERKLFLFGIGTDFRKLKYPFVWYDILHVVDVLSRFPYVHTDRRFREMVATVTAQANSDGRYTAGSMYRAWNNWSFADKKNPSRWLTFLVTRVLKRCGCQASM